MELFPTPLSPMTTTLRVNTDPDIMQRLFCRYTLVWMKVMDLQRFSKNARGISIVLYLKERQKRE